MQKVFLISLLITVLFCATKFVEMKYVDKEFKPLKFIVRDAVIVMTCSVISLYAGFYLETTIMNMYSVVTDQKIINTATTQIFTDDPGF
jgi:hypothetical protein